MGSFQCVGFIVLMFAHLLVQGKRFSFCWMSARLLYFIGRGEGALTLKSIEIENHKSQLRVGGGRDFFLEAICKWKCRKRLGSCPYYIRCSLFTTKNYKLQKFLHHSNVCPLFS